MVSMLKESFLLTTGIQCSKVHWQTIDS